MFDLFCVKCGKVESHPLDFTFSRKITFSLKCFICDECMKTHKKKLAKNKDKAVKKKNDCGRG